MIKANSLFNNKFCFNINFEDIIERLSITRSVKKKTTFNSRCVSSDSYTWRNERRIGDAFSPLTF